MVGPLGANCDRYHQLPIYSLEVVRENRTVQSQKAYHGLGV